MSKNVTKVKSTVIFHCALWFNNNSSKQGKNVVKSLTSDTFPFFLAFLCLLFSFINNPVIYDTE